MGPVSMALYRGIAVPALRLGLAVMAPFHQKLAQRRREEASSWDRARLQLTSDSRPRIWFHAASMGELEQLLPIIERVRLLQPPLCIVTTCTSPSGRSHAAKQKSIDHALYLPVDNWRSLNEFVDVVRPTLVVIDRYDVWPVMVSTLHKRRIRTMLVNATLPSGANVPLLRGFTQRLYAMLDEIIAVTPEDAQAFSGLLAREVAWLPDTRMDRVLEKRATLQNVSSGLPQWHGKTLVLGSTWPDDERMMLEAWLAITPPGWRMIIVPHEPTEEALASIERRLPCVRLSRAQNVSDDRSPHVLVDSVGMLLQLYAIADAAYVGGGFAAGVHSLAEPAGYGMPIACGPRIDRSRDARGLQAHHALSIVHTDAEARKWVEMIQNVEFRASARERCSEFIHDNTGSADVIMHRLQPLLERLSVTDGSVQPL